MNFISSPPAHRWLQLQTELRDLAFVLDRKGNPAAADLAATVAARIGELLHEETGADRHTQRPASRPLLS
jgi:hypothetical protein